MYINMLEPGSICERYSNWGGQNVKYGVRLQSSLRSEKLGRRSGEARKEARGAVGVLGSCVPGRQLLGIARPCQRN